MAQPRKWWIGYLIATLLALTLAEMYAFVPRPEELSYSDFKVSLRKGRVSDLTLDRQTITGTFAREGREGGPVAFVTRRVEDPGLVAELEGAKVTFRARVEHTWLTTLLSWLLPALLFVGVWMFVMRRIGGARGDLLAIGKSKAMLIVGAPGTGKTLLAKAVAGEAGVPFFSLTGSDFVEMFVGVGAARVRDLFAQVQEKAPSIIFIDELDALGKARGVSTLTSGHDEREQTLNQLLAEMDGFDTQKGVILLAATNRPEILDPALLRPGRFDRQVVIDRPDLKGREKILLVHTRKVKLAPGLDISQVAARTPGFVGADLANIVNEAALRAARLGKNAVDMTDFDEAIDRVVAGLERKSRVINPREKEIVAYHEAGHALVAESRPHADRVAKVSIIPRGVAALGHGRVRETLTTKRATLEALAKRLIEQEVVDREGLVRLIADVDGP